MARQLLIDSCDFVIDRTQGKSGFITETRNGLELTRASGRLGFYDQVNGNKRIYPKKVWEVNFSAGSPLMNRLALHRTFGTLEHPEDGKVSLRSPISHCVTDANLNDDGSITGEIVFLNNPDGLKVRSLIEVGYNPTVSSRGWGSLVKDNSNVDVVQEDYVCEGWDVVMDPSFDQAVIEVHASEVAPQPVNTPVPPPSANLESKIQPISAPAPVKTVTKVMEDSKPGGVVTPRSNQHIMDANQIRTSLRTFAALDVSKLTPQQYADDMRQMESLHQHVTVWSTEDQANRGWDATRLHEEISTVQDRWTKAVSRPSVEVTRLSEDRSKLLRVTEKIIQTGVTLKKKLTEALTANGQLMELNKKNLKRGRSWQKYAEGLKESKTGLKEKYDISTTALGILSGKYRTLVNESRDDVVRLGRRVLELEFKSQLNEKPDILEKLKSAKTPDQLASIRELLDPRQKRRTRIKESTRSNQSQTSITDSPPASRTNQSNQEQVTVRSPDTKAEIGKIIVQVGNPRNVSESIAIARRLGTSVPSMDMNRPVNAS